jgi:hypothetical protein
MPVTIQNRSWQMQVFNLVHDAYCRGRACSCTDITTVVVDENPRTGDRAPRRVPKRIPAALTLLAREVRPGLPSTVLQVPDVRAAIARGILRVVAQTPDVPPPTSAPAKAGPGAERPAAPESPRAAGGTPACGRSVRSTEGARARAATPDRKEG